ncbi:hypothetical protein ACI3L1_18590 [Deinococcus sp. SM5_A1]|uniref:hypothetical protein n=1 Tax=Deinococcus sp. SM5_A1 TaxID=3379094 RepID=UPI00385EA708
MPAPRLSVAALPGPREPNLLPYVLIMFFGMIILPLLILMNNGAVLPVAVLNARCEAAYRASAYPQLTVPNFSFRYSARYPSFIPETSDRNVMVVSDFTARLPDPAAPPRVVLACKTDLNGRIKLGPL